MYLIHESQIRKYKWLYSIQSRKSPYNTYYLRFSFLLPVGNHTVSGKFFPRDVIKIQANMNISSLPLFTAPF